MLYPHQKHSCSSLKKREVMLIPGIFVCDCNLKPISLLPKLYVSCYLSARNTFLRLRNLHQYSIPHINIYFFKAWKCFFTKGKNYMNSSHSLAERQFLQCIILNLKRQIIFYFEVNNIVAIKFILIFLIMEEI